MQEKDLDIGKGRRTAMEAKRQREKILYVLFAAALLALSAVAAVRSLIIGLDIDEQYAVTLSYRLARGDLLVKEVWEPHQLSALLPSLFVRLFLLCRGNTEYLVLYLRIMGLLLQILVSVYWYYVISRLYSPKKGFLTALIVFHTLPKGILTPEFANQQIWFLLLLFLCVLQYGRSFRIRHCVAAGFFMVLEVLAYPSCVFLFPVYAILLWQLEKAEQAGRRRHLGTELFVAECIAAAAGFVVYLLCHMSLSELLLCIRYIFADGEHSAGIGEKLISYVGELPEIALYLLIYAAVAGLLTGLLFLLWRAGKRQRNFWAAYAWVLLCVAMTDQVRLWSLGQAANVHPQIHYLILFGIGGILFLQHRKKKDRAEEQLLFWGGWFPALLALLSVLLLTNLDIKASLVHLLPGVLAAFLLWEETAENKAAVSLMLLLWCLVLIGSRIMLVRETGENKGTIFVVKQKVLDGAAKNIYAPYTTGYTINAQYDFLAEKLSKDSKVWYLGYDTLICLIGEQQICSASTISTPVYDQRYLSYFEVNPEKEPDYIVANRSLWEEQSSIIDAEVREWILENYVSCGQDESLYCLLWMKKENSSK